MSESFNYAKFTQQSIFDVMPNELDSLEQALRRLPKIDLHAHLTGCARIDTVQEFIHQYGVSVPKTARLDLVGSLVFQVPTKSLYASFRPWRHVLNRVTGLPNEMNDIITRLIMEAAEDFANDGVIYAELRVSPRLPLKNGCLHEFLEVVDSAISTARSRFKTELRIVLGFTRHEFGHLDARRQANYVVDVLTAAEPYRGHSIVGFDLWGNESEYPPRLFVDPFRAVSDAGYPLTIHAGEASPALFIREAVELLGCQRLGHATAITEESDLFGLVRQQDILLEACLTSNWITGVVNNLHLHPVREMIAAGVAVTLCTDNTLVFNTSLSREFAKALRSGLISADDVPRLLGDAASHIFAPTHIRENLRSQIRVAFTPDVLQYLQQLSDPYEGRLTTAMSGERARFEA